jgi:hypothetical protein
VYADRIAPLDIGITPGGTPPGAYNNCKRELFGDQYWMAENLRVSKYCNGDPIPINLNNIQWANTTSGAYAIYLHKDMT